jgi:hypothetical protein
VDQVRLGDHAFACYADDDVRWETAALFAAGGRGLGYKVIVVPDPAVSRPEARERLASLGALGPALSAGQVSCASMREIISPDRRFSPGRQLSRLSAAAAQARREGYAGLGLYIDMRWVHDLGFGTGPMMRWETGAHELFAAGGLAAVCAYDRRAFASATRTSRPGPRSRPPSRPRWTPPRAARCLTCPGCRSCRRAAPGTCCGWPKRTLPAG